MWRLGFLVLCAFSCFSSLCFSSAPAAVPITAAATARTTTAVSVIHRVGLERNPPPPPLQMFRIRFHFCFDSLQYVSLCVVPANEIATPLMDLMSFTLLFWNYLTRRLLLPPSFPRSSVLSSRFMYSNWVVAERVHLHWIGSYPHHVFASDDVNKYCSNQYSWQLSIIDSPLILRTHFLNERIYW